MIKRLRIVPTVTTVPRMLTMTVKLVTVLPIVTVMTSQLDHIWNQLEHKPLGTPVSGFLDQIV